MLILQVNKATLVMYRNTAHSVQLEMICGKFVYTRELHGDGDDGNTVVMGLILWQTLR